MAQIAFVLLCHRDPEGVLALAELLASQGDGVAVHLDARAPAGAYRTLERGAAGLERVALVGNRVACGWGEWSLVEATLRACRTALDAFPDARHVYMVSGDCMPIRPASEVRARLAEADADWIESVDFFRGKWIRTGMHEDRLIYRHWVNERTRKRLFYASLDIQRRLGLRRRPPRDLAIMIGSQWWCLRRETVDAVLDFTRRRPDVRRFFRTTWIPDETYFQTLVRHLVPRERIRSRTPTFLTFTDYGMPAGFHDDHLEMLRAQDAFFARKIAPDAAGLKAALAAVWRDGAPVPADGRGHRLHRFVTDAGREGRRSAPRAWGAGAEIGPGQTLVIVVAKKWHQGQRLARRLAEETGMRSTGYVFDEQAVDLPDMGGIGDSLDKRRRDRRATLSLIFAGWETSALAICVDPSSATDLVAACAGDPGRVQVVEIATDWTDAWLSGHARRMGLVSETTPAAAQATVLPFLRRTLEAERTALARVAGPGLARLHPQDDVDTRADALARALRTVAPPEAARRIAETPGLLDD